MTYDRLQIFPSHVEPGDKILGMPGRSITGSYLAGPSDIAAGAINARIGEGQLWFITFDDGTELPCPVGPNTWARGKRDILRPKADSRPSGY